MFWLRDLVRGSDLDALHPLRLGFDAAESELRRARQLTESEKQSLAGLKIAAPIVKEALQRWGKHDERLIADLRDSRACKALLFELHVLAFAIAPLAREVRWTRYEEATPDIWSESPTMGVECKTVTSAELSRERVLSALSRARKQHEGWEPPLVIAVGFEGPFSREEIDDVLSLAGTCRQWFKDHPDISAGLIFTPADEFARPHWPVRSVLEGLQGTTVLHGAVTEVVHHASSRPLPAGFTFNAEVWRERRRQGATP